MAEAVKSAMRFLALGDSYTIGEAVAPEESWPHQLVHLAQARGIGIERPVIIARTGWTTDELIEAIAHSTVTGTFHLVSLLIGVNNLYRGRPLSEYRTELKQLLKLAVQFADGHANQVRVLSIPDWGATPFANGKDRSEISRTTDQFNAVCREESERAGAQWIDVTGTSREGLRQPDLLTTDLLHPSGTMYHAWALSVLASLKRSDTHE